jgi:hypothetical protein
MDIAPGFATLRRARKKFAKILDVFRIRSDLMSAVNSYPP